MRNQNIIAFAPHETLISDACTPENDTRFSHEPVRCYFVTAWRQCYNAPTMNRILASIWTVILVMALALPSIGPLIDHHFAERSPTHHHVSITIDHTHEFRVFHGHLDIETVPNDSTALYNYDTSLVTIIPMMIDDAALRISERFDPSSTFIIPLFARVPRADHITTPPDRPPQPVA